MTPDTQTLKRNLPESVRALCQRLVQAGHRSWIVGGCVRDELLVDLDGEDAAHASLRNDWDIATTARPEQVQRLFSHVIPTGIKHGTVTVMINGVGYEVTTLRGETSYSDGRRPDSVYFVDDIVADLARRDFTINAIAYDPLNDTLIDPFSGYRDLRDKRLKAVGDPAERFAEDGLRVLRAARFVAALEVELDDDTARAIEPSLISYRKVSPERIRDEWMKSLKARKPSRAFEVMREHGLLGVSAPELLESVGCEQNRHHAHDVWRHAMSCLDNCPAAPVLRLAGLLHDVGKPRSRAFSDETQDYTFYDHENIGADMAAPMLERLRFSNDERERVVSLVRHHLICYEQSWSDAAVRRWVRRVSPELLPELYQLNRADVKAKGGEPAAGLARLEALQERVARVLEAGAALSTRELAVNGHDLMQKLGKPAGPWLGKLLSALLEEVIEDPSKNHADTLIARARELESNA